MQQFTFSFAMSMLNSQRVKAAVASAAFFGATGALRGACARLESFSKTIHAIEDRYPERADKMRHSQVFTDLNAKAEAAASRAAGIHAIAEEHGVMIRLEFEPPMPKAKTQSELEQLATITKIDMATIAKHVDQANERKYQSELEAADIAASLFWTATADTDAPLKFESVQKAIDRTRLNLLTWSSIDFAELALIASDEAALNGWQECMSDDPSQFAENTMEDDEIEEQQRRSEIEALDRHARQQETIAYLDAERKKAANAAKKRTRVKAAA